MRFEILSKLALGILVMPHSTADVERVFSELGDIKTKKGTSLIITI